RKTRAPAKVRAARGGPSIARKPRGPDAPPGGYRIACEMSHSLVSFDQVLCIAYAPLPMVTFAAAPWPERSQAHSSPFSWPNKEVQPPGGFCSVSVSAYSWPFTIEKPSSRPAEPPLTKFSPQLAPWSVTYGMLVYARSP